MDNPDSISSYDAQLLQVNDVPVCLCGKVQKMNTDCLKNGVFRHMTGIVMTHMTARAGIKKHGQVAVDALIQEFAQLHNWGCLQRNRPEFYHTNKRKDL
jgi:hypothetical protein